MTSVSLPRAVSRRSSGYEAEREEYLRAQAAAVAKAINTQENAVKQKHIRTLIIGTHREKGAGTFWNNVSRITLESNPIVSWKFCHVLHKLLRDGHARTVADSMKFRNKLSDLGRLWGHLKDGYGTLIKLYSKLLVTKLTFHQQNPRIPGNLQMTDEELEAVGEKDVNNWFELTVEMLDYQDEILTLQAAVFNSLDMSRATSMTTSGQCRLAPLILCILDSSCLYDYIVKMMFKLHAALPADVLAGHRNRFNKQFKELKQFYHSSSNLQYFKYLVSIPPLPETPPNFLVASDFDNYVTPKVTVHGEGSEAGWDTPPDSRSVIDAPLVDVTEPERPVPTPQPPPPVQQYNGPDLSAELAQKDQIIMALRHELEDARAALLRYQEQYQASVGQLRQRIAQLETELANSKELIEHVTEENERYRAQAEQLQNEKNQQIASKLEESEKKAQSSEDKFKKMKEVYAKLRDEHIDTLKKLQSSQKEMNELRANMAQLLASQQSDINSDELDTLIEKEMNMMDEAIRLAAAKIEEILQKNREESSGVRLEVNEKILDACTALMRAIMELVRNAKKLQQEIVEQGRGTGSVMEFYKRHHQWTEGLLSAAKAVGLGAHVLVETADRTMSGNGKYEELMVASQEIAASVAQLVVASRVKADPSSVQLAALSGSSKSVTSATAAVVGNVKSARETLNEKDSLDFSHLSLHQAKRLEMDSQVRVLELESEVEKERVRLSELRKRHYQLAGPAEGWTDN